MLNWQQLNDFLVQHGVAEREVWIGLSGGVDSVSLLHLAQQLAKHTDIVVKAIHVHHGLSDNADTWQQQVTELCQQLAIPLVSKRIQIEPQSRTSLEQLARDGRYQAIAETMPTRALLLTGHHCADQFETFVLRLMRGSGLTGLTAMKPLSDMPNPLAISKEIKLARPLLSVVKSEILHYAQQHQLAWVEDESNQDQRFDRNFVRASVLPVFEQRWEKAAEAVATSAQLLQSESALLNEYLEAELIQLTVAGFSGLVGLDLIKLMALSSDKQAALVRLFVHQQVGQFPSRTSLQELLTKLVHSRSDSQPELKLDHHHALYIHNAILYAQVSTASWIAPATDLITCAIPEGSENQQIHLNDNPLYRSIAVKGCLQSELLIGFGRLSDKLRPHSNSGSKKVKDVLKQHKCPPWLRAYVPLFYQGDKLIAIGDVMQDQAFPAQIQIELK